jgi:hypothetical protein
MSFPLSARTAIGSYALQRVKDNIGDERPAAAFLAARLACTRRRVSGNDLARSVGSGTAGTGRGRLSGGCQIAGHHYHVVAQD